MQVLVRYNYTRNTYTRYLVVCDVKYEMSVPVLQRTYLGRPILDVI